MREVDDAENVDDDRAQLLLVEPVERHLAVLRVGLLDHVALREAQCRLCGLEELWARLELIGLHQVPGGEGVAHDVVLVRVPVLGGPELVDHGAIGLKVRQIPLA